MKGFIPSRRFGTVLVHSIFAAGFALLASAPFASAQQNAPQPPPAATTVALPLAYPTEFNGDLRTLPQTFLPPQYYLLLNEFEGPPNQKPPPGPEASRPQPAVQMLGPMPSASANFAGLGFTTAVNGGQAGGGWPPDTNGDVGPKYYIQSVNTAIGIFDKSTGALTASFRFNQFWAASGGSTICQTNNDGDPVVLHDARNDRWIITDFAFGFSGGNPVAPFYECIAVSKSGDPVAGGWWFYAVQVDTNASGGPPAGTLNDYPKFGLWNDGCLYMGANGFTEPGGSYAGSIVASFSTTDMYAGNPLTSSIGFLSYASGNEFALFPADLLGSSAGSLPPGGTPEYFVAESLSAFAFNVRKFTPGSNCGGGGTLGAATAVSQTSYTYNGGQYIPQPATTNLLDSLEDRVMQRVQYRKIGSAESLWVTHTTGGGGTPTVPAQPQWAQINVSGGTIVTTPVQQQIYAPDSNEYRWMAALAVDGLGDMAMGYSRSSGNAGDYPSIYYAGRLAGDAANTLPQSEVALATGGGSQTNNCGGAPCHRWGDYSSMTIDPSDDCTFWYTTEYYVNQTQGTAGNWQTRIGSFRFPNCINKLVFSLEPGASYAANAPITVDVSVEDVNGNLLTRDTSTVTLALSGGTAGATLGGTTSVAAVNGVATFSNLTVNKVGTGYVLNATDGSLAGVASTAFNITAGAPATIAFALQPGTNADITAGSTIPLIANVTDSGGNPVSGDSVTLAIGNNPGSSTLSATANPVTTDASGNATFNGLSLNKVGTGYTLTAADGIAPTATGNAFNIVAGAASQLVFTTQPANVVAPSTLNTIAVTEEDAGGNTVTSDSTTGVNFTVSACGGTALGSATMSGGVATLSPTQVFSTLRSGLTVSASDPTLSLSAISQSFNVDNASPSDLLFIDGFETCTL